MTEVIRVDEDTHAVLRSLKGTDETYDDVISRLLDQRCECVRSGTGLWEGTDAAETARKARKRMKESGDY